jgi:NTP pyrophosphatase (non-canonical NTP hydrolase)
MSDAKTTISELREIIRKFVDERDWRQFHAPKNLAMALAIEAAELMEHFQWLNVDDSRELIGDREKLAAIGEELADVIGYGLALANELNLDVSDSIRNKMVKNAQKYPADEFRGRYSREQKGRSENS